MKTNFNFTVFAVVLSLLLLNLATLHPAEEPGADYAAGPPSVAAARPDSLVAASSKVLITSQFRRPALAARPHYRAAATGRR